ncbi:MAG: MFS transporter [Gordonia sp. (in: high G+C Gram-positive bacteria)]|uniref:MFS transporter n=1 Tax=Gordonia sp. (in: high G+C Gram-positive bacteria) TaxID=84139 RepID=UPI0039E23906
MRTRVGRGWMTLFTLAWLIIWMVQLTPLQLLLPLQLDDQVSSDGDRWVHGVVVSGLILGVGGLVGVVAGPLAGALSDRTDSRRFPTWLGGRRRVWSLAGVWLTTICLVLTGFAHRPVFVGAAWIGVSVGVAIASAAFTALIADQLPADQRGAASAAVGSSQAAGIVVGVGLIVTLGLSVLVGYLVLAILIAVVGTGAACLLPDPKRPGETHKAASERDALRSLRDRDFSWMLTGRLVANIGNALGTSLFLFFLLYGLHQEKSTAEDNLLVLVVVYTVFVVISSIVSGIYSDRTGHRRALTVAAAMVQALSGVAICAHQTFTMTIVGAALMGVGYGAFSTVGLAFATDLLPHEEDHGRDLGVVNVAAALGQLIGPILGAGLVAAVGGFSLLFAMAAVLSVVGGLLTLRAREHTAPTLTAP